MNINEGLFHQSSAGIKVYLTHNVIDTPDIYAEPEKSHRRILPKLCYLTQVLSNRLQISIAVLRQMMTVGKIHPYVKMSSSQ